MAQLGNKFIHILATKDDDGTTWNANGNYSSEPASFQVKPHVSDIYSIRRVLVTVKDVNINNSDEYGSISVLTNGVQFFVKDSNGNTLSQITSFPVRTNGDWKSHCFDADAFSLGNGNDYFVCRWTFDKSGASIILDGRQGQHIEVLLNDNFTGITEHKFLFEGIYLDEKY